MSDKEKQKEKKVLETYVKTLEPAPDHTRPSSQKKWNAWELYNRDFVTNLRLYSKSGSIDSIP